MAERLWAHTTEQSIITLAEQLLRVDAEGLELNACLHLLKYFFFLHLLDLVCLSVSEPSLLPVKCMLVGKQVPNIVCQVRLVIFNC